MSRTSGITGRMTETVVPQRIDGFAYLPAAVYMSEI